MGEVLICGTSDSEQYAALKSFKPHLFFDRESRNAFLTEIAIWFRLTGTPFVMPAMGIHEYDGRYFVIMPAIGEDERKVGTVADLISLRAGTPVEAFTIAWQLAVGMKLVGDAIPGVSHGDLKPANLLYNGGPVMISDFGLASVGRADGRPLRATPKYEAPEYASTGPTPASDVYAFGVILAELAESCSIPRATVHDSLIFSLKDIAERCRVRRAEERLSFAGVVKALGDLILANPNELRGALMVAAGFRGMFQDFRAIALPQIVKALLKVDEPRQAMNALESIDEDSDDAELLMLKGTCLSLLDRDVEALHWFRKSLQTPMDEATRFHCLSELGLSLKRLRRLDEAESAYLDLLARATGQEISQVVVNLAGVYSEGEKHQKAVNLLIPFVRENPEVPLAYAALGNAYEGLGFYEKAASQYQRAIDLAPQFAHIQVRYARICLRHILLWEEADAALYAASHQGYASREWLVLALASSTLTGRVGDAEALMMAVKRDLPAEEAERVEKEAMELVIAALRQASGDTKEERSAASTEAEPASIKDDRGESSKATPRVGEIAATSSIEGFQRAGLPFFNVRFYFPENRFSYDYYDDIARPDYVQGFVEALNRFRRNPEMTNGAEPRPDPPYFHLCPICKVVILTNRDKGAGLHCRQCDQKHPAGSFDIGDSNLLASVHNALGKVLGNSKGLRQILMFQAVDRDPTLTAQMNEICDAEGFENFENCGSPLRFLLRARADRSGLAFDYNRDITVVSKVGVSEEPSFKGDTPPETDRLIRHLRVISPIFSISVQLDPDGDDLMSLLLGGRAEQLEAQCRHAVEEAPEGLMQLVLLSVVLQAHGKLEEAKAFALRATIAAPQDSSSWMTLGLLEKDLEEYSTAVTHLNTSLMLDPLNRGALVGLAFCYEKLGNVEKSQETSARVQALGGPISLSSSH